jgi:hypothetical protein
MHRWERIMAKAIKRRDTWSMKTDRELIALSKTKTLPALVQHFQRPPKLILNKAKKLGLSIRHEKAKGK